MAKKNLSSVNATQSNVNNMVVENVSNETTTKSKKSVKPDVLENSANSLEEENNPKKKEIFSRVKREIFGISEFDGNTNENREMAQKFASGQISFEEYTKFISSARKNSANSNTEKENLTFADVCKKISESDLAKDFCYYVSSDLLSLESLLVDNGKVVVFHGKQSESGEKFIADKVTIKGKHKPYSDTIYKSFAEITTSNILKSFQCYSYYKDSLKRCKRQRKTENDLVTLFIDAKSKLMKDFGYSEKDLAEL